MVLCCSETHKIEEVLLIVQSHMHAKLLENSHKGGVSNKIVAPVVYLTLALKAETVEHLRLNVVSFE